MYWQQRVHPVGKGCRPWIFHQFYPHAWSRVELPHDVQPAMKRSSKSEGKKKKKSWKAPKPQLFVLSFFLGFKWSCRELSSGTGLAAPHILLYHECSGIFWQNYHKRLREFSLNHRIYPVRFGSSTGPWKRTFMRLHSTENLQQTTLAKYFKVILQVLMAQFFFLPAADALAAPVLFSKCKCSCHCLRVILFFRV